MKFQTFITEFSDLAEKVFSDRNEFKAPAKAKVWCDTCIKDIKLGKYSPESVIRAMERLQRSDCRFLTLSDLMDEIKQERFLEVG